MAAMADSGADGAQADGEDGADSAPASFRPSRPLVSRPARRIPRLPTPEQQALILQGVAVPRSTRPPSLENVAPRSMRLEPPHAELFITQGAASRLEPPTKDLGTENPILLGAATRLEPPTACLGKDELFLQGSATCLEPPTDSGTELSRAARPSLNPRAAPTIGMAAYSSNDACPLSNVDRPAAAVLNISASMNLAPSPRPLAAPWVPTMDQPSAIVVGEGGSSSPPAIALPPTSPEAINPPRAAPPRTSTEMAAQYSSLNQPLIAPISGSAAAGIAPATLPESSNSSPRFWPAPPQQPAATANHLQPSGLWATVPQPPSIGSAPATSPPKILIGNISLKPCSDLFVSEDKIATAFHNSSRKTLTYIPPSEQNGEVLVRPTIDMIREGSNRWNTTAVGYFLGKRPYFHHLKDFVLSIWPAVQDVKATSNGFFFFQFKTMAALEEVLEGGPWLYLGQPIVLQKWEPGMVLRKLKHTEVPVWIKLRHLPVELWATDGLSTVASGIGRPLYPDAITRACTRLDFARVCVMLNVNSKLPKHIVIMIPNEHGGESACKVDVEYEWLPPKCTNCTSLGHATKECPLTKPMKPAISIYVKRNQIPAPASRTGDPIPNPDPIFDQPVDKDDMRSNELPHKKTDKGKQIVTYNAFDILRDADEDADEVIRGPNTCSPSDVSPC
ncbi:UNVERIFIED_CONTAM: hypothetical protein Sradi_7058700 [Sesamum radiatum]|uniref:CCHC-type domain-containing protein n=1 Tax=Sesamum radiatum TaxID=300843 RepID=A0AAW2J6H9_SESRA